MKHLLTINDLSREEIYDILLKAKEIKKNPEHYKEAAFEKTLFMLFQVPSLRTVISFEVAMTQMGGHAINYHAEKSPWGLGKESIEDVARTTARYCDLFMARMHDHEELEKLAKNSPIPVINGLTSFAHPCQIIGDLVTILERRKKLEGLKIAYLGDGLNNVTHDWMYAAAKVGMHISVACPNKKEFLPDIRVREETQRIAKTTGSIIEITDDPKKAVKNADVVYTDSWISYRVPESEYAQRIKILKPFRVTEQLFENTKKDAFFMHCLPAKRDQEVEANVIDGGRSIVFDQAENRLHAQKAIIIYLMQKKRGK